MESYVNLLSPIDNFNFTHLTNYNTSCVDSADSAKPASLQLVSERAVNSDTLPDIWHGLLEGPQVDYLSSSPWSFDFLSQRQPAASPWRPHFYRSISEPFSDSPSSSSTLFSSATCSPWETCPGLAPSSPQLSFQEALNSLYPDALDFSTIDETPAQVFNGLSLNSPVRSPIPLPFHPHSNLADMTTQTRAVESSSSLANALDLSFAENGNPVVDSYEVRTALEESGSDLPACREELPVPSPSLLAGVVNPDPVVCHESYVEGPGLSPIGLPSEISMQSRVTRPKATSFSYSEESYETDSDGDYEDWIGDETLRSRKRTRKARHDFDSDDDESEDDARHAPRRRNSGPKGTGRGKRTGGPGDLQSTANSKRKYKRRHHCPREGCLSSFTRVTDMDRHIASVHRAPENNTNRCSFCGKAFSRDDAVLRHENDSCPMRPKKKPTDHWL